jgi:hypothetical protein
MGIGEGRENYLGEARRLGIIKVVHAVPDRLENPDPER